MNYLTVRGNLIEVSIERFPGNIGCKLINIKNEFPVVINVSFIQILISSRGTNSQLFIIRNEVTTVDRVSVLFQSLNITYSRKLQFGIILKKVNVHFNGPVDISNNKFKFSIMHFQSCNVSFSGAIKLYKNYCSNIISLDSYIKILEYSNISFVKNTYQNSLLAVENTEEYNQPYPVCLFQYIAMNRNTITDLLSHYNITFYHNYPTYSSVNHKMCSVSVSFSSIISHCKWLPSVTFHNHSPVTVNKQIIQNDDQSCGYNDKLILCYCSQNKVINCSNDVLGVVYPGETLQTNICKKSGDNDSAVLYAEVHNANLPNSTCKIAH